MEKIKLTKKEKIQFHKLVSAIDSNGCQNKKEEKVLLNALFKIEKYI